MSTIDLEKIRVVRNNIPLLKASMERNNFLYQFAENIASTLNIYFVGIYSIDRLKEYVFFTAGSGLIGEKLRSHPPKIRLEKESSFSNQISTAAFHNEIRLVNWFEDKIVCYQILDNKIPEFKSEIKAVEYFRSPNFPKTRTELYLPLRVHGEIIGIMELNFSVDANFTIEEIESLQLLVNELAKFLD